MKGAAKLRRGFEREALREALDAFGAREGAFTEAALAPSEPVNYLPGFFERLREAHEATRAADLYDVTDEPERRRSWRELCLRQDREVARLVSYVMTHGQAISVQLAEVNARHAKTSES